MTTKWSSGKKGLKMSARLKRIFEDMDIRVREDILQPKCLLGATDIFRGGIYGAATPSMPQKVSPENIPLAVYLNTVDGTTSELLEDFGDPKRLCLTEGQIVSFCSISQNSFRMGRSGGYGTLFLFENNRGSISIARVSILITANLLLDVEDLIQDPGIWRAADHTLHVIVPEE